MFLNLGGKLWCAVKWESGLGRIGEKGFFQRGVCWHIQGSSDGGEGPRPTWIELSAGRVAFEQINSSSFSIPSSTSYVVSLLLLDSRGKLLEALPQFGFPWTEHGG